MTCITGKKTTSVESEPCEGSSRTSLTEVGTVIFGMSPPNLTEVSRRAARERNCKEMHKLGRRKGKMMEGVS
jgi:hypothetical protein